MSMEERSIDTMTLDGGWLCLDFINTVHDRSVEEPFDYISDYRKLLEWSLKVESLSVSEKKRLEKNAKADRKKANREHENVIKARGVLYDFFLPIAQNKTPADNSQAEFNSLLRQTMSQIELKLEDHFEVSQGWKNRSDLAYPLYPVIKSAYDLLTMDKLDRVKECGACGWLFLDQSKNKSRKWCSMESCGSNVKAKRYYYRNKKKKEE